MEIIENRKPKFKVIIDSIRRIREGNPSPSHNISTGPMSLPWGVPWPGQVPCPFLERGGSLGKVRMGGGIPSQVRMRVPLVRSGWGTPLPKQDKPGTVCCSGYASCGFPKEDFLLSNNSSSKPSKY